MLTAPAPFESLQVLTQEVRVCMSMKEEAKGLKHQHWILS